MASPIVSEGSFLTLHYRLSLAESDEALFDTFAQRPATVQLGTGQLAAPLEALLVGLAEGEERSFSLTPDQGFGPRNPELIRTVSQALLAEHADPADPLAPGDVVEFPAPGGGRYAGVLKSVDADGALFDFNHPLAGHALRFDVRIIGVMD